MEKIVREMQQIEDRDPNYLNNKRWQKLKRTQDVFLLEKAKNKLYELKLKVNPKGLQKKQMEEMEKYIKENS